MKLYFIKILFITKYFTKKIILVSQSYFFYSNIETIQD